MGHQNILLFGATGAVGGEVLKTLLALPQVKKVTVLGRRKLELIHDKLVQETANLEDPNSYSRSLEGHSYAICALGVGQPSKMSREEFVRIDKDMVLTIARACHEKGVKGFSLLSAVGVSPHSSVWYSRVKGQLEDGLRALRFEQLRLFHPSMILTPTNRYGWSQALLLKLWPLVSLLLIGSLSRFKGIRVEELGSAMAICAVTDEEPGEKILCWKEFKDLTRNAAKF